LFKGAKKTPKITKILGKFPETNWDTNNPNKVFGAHEKDFRASNK
jgi:CRISPR/Cas system CSM-associated protein Csm5 (group 7 of RAMP superfamily)